MCPSVNGILKGFRWTSVRDSYRMIQAVSLHGKQRTNYCRAWQTIFKWFEAASAENKLKW